MVHEQKRYFRCPDGVITDDVAVYGKSWKEFGDYVEKFFPGYEVIAYDPFLRLKATDPRCTDYFDISLKGALALLGGKY